MFQVKWCALLEFITQHDLFITSLWIKFKIKLESLNFFLISTFVVHIFHFLVIRTKLVSIDALLDKLPVP